MTEPMLNGLTEAETNASASVMGLTRPEPEPVQEPFFTEANGFPQTFVSKDRQKNAIISLTEQCADLIRERDELQKQVWLYEKNGVTCQTYHHTVEQSCAECNVQMSYTAPPQCKPLTDQEIIEAIKHISHNEMSAFAIARAIERVIK